MLGFLFLAFDLVALIFVVPVPLPVDTVLQTYFFACAIEYFDPAHAFAFLTFLVPVPLPVDTVGMI